jgi:hypothetical protein
MSSIRGGEVEKNKQPSAALIGKLYIESMYCAILLAPMQNCVCKIRGHYYYGEEIRSQLITLFQEHRMPKTMKEYLLISWIEPLARHMLSTIGGPVDETTGFLQAIDRDQTEYLIARFQRMKTSFKENEHDERYPLAQKTAI